MGPDPLPGGSTCKIFKGFPPLLSIFLTFFIFILLHLEYLFYLFDSFQYQINGHNGSLRVLHPTTQKSCRSLWFRRMDFMPWLEYMKEQKRLHIIKDPSVSGDLNKRLQCTEEKIKAQMKNMKVKIKIEEGESSTTSAPKRKTEGKKKPERKKRKNIKAPSKESSPEPDVDSIDPVVKPEVSPVSSSKTEKGHPTTAGKSPRDFSKLPPPTSAGGSDIDSEGSETDGQ